MNERREVEEVEEIKEVKEKCGEIAAFFDLDGTLVALPSLERRFFRILRYRREIPAKNYFLWLGEALRLMPRGICAISQANKMYLRGVQSFDERDQGDENLSSWHKDGHRATGHASAPPRRNPRLPVPAFFAQAIERVAWHAKQGHAIVLLSGTLEPLAQLASRAITAALAARGIVVAIQVCATRLEEKNGRWTGRTFGEAMFGDAKARAVKRLAGELQLDLARCYAYGDSANDRWLLAAVGWAAAVNPPRELARLAKIRGWPILHWEREKKTITQRGKYPRTISERLPGNGNTKNGAAKIVGRTG